MGAVADLIYRLALALWVGGISIYTFLVTPAVFRAFSRDEAGRIVGVLFPWYYPFTLGVSAVALAALLAGARPWRALHWLGAALILAAVAANAYAQFRVHPESVAVKSEIHAGEALPPEHSLRQRFSRLHGQAMALNLAVLADGVVLLLLLPTLRR